MRRLLALVCGVALLACGSRDSGDSAAEVPPPAAAEAAATRLGLAASALSAPLPRPEFTLTDTGGRRFAFQEATAGKLTLLFFGYTHCPDVCPNQLSSLAAGLRQLPAEQREQVLVVFVGVDAARDTRERVRAWLDHFDPRFVGLVGTEEELAAAQQAALVPKAAVEDRWQGGYTLAHASWFLLYTPDDQAHLRYGLGVSAAQWAHDLGVLVAQGWPLAGEAHAAQGGVAVREPRIPAPAADVAALYLVIVDPDGADDRLLGARSEIGEAQLHETREQGGRVAMRRAQGGLPVPAHGELRLEPGGAHIMLTGLRRPLRVGERVRVTLEFERAGRVALEVPVVPAEAAGDVASVPPDPAASPRR